MQHLILHWLKDGDRNCKAKHGVVFDDYELLDIESNQEEALHTFIFPQHGSS